jgi:OPA family glycerol-3-phosphate transporter-like MFS transporter
MVPKRGRLRDWQVLTVALLIAGYAGYYLCRSNFAVALPLLVDDLSASGMSADRAKVLLGRVASLGTLGYAVGKFFSGSLADFLGGRRNFLLGMAGAIACTVLFALGGSIPAFTAAWVGNRLLQSLGWVGMVKIASRWFSYASYGRVMAAVSLSFLFGDAAARKFMGSLRAAGLGWRPIFFVAAGILTGLFVLSVWLLKESPKEVGEEEPRANPLNLYGEGGEAPRPPGLRALIGPMLRSPAFGCVCALSLGLTLLRETFNTWTVQYFTDAVGLSASAAADQSAWFPFFGGVSVIMAGFAADRLGRAGRAAVILGGMALAGLALLALGRLDLGGSTAAPVALVALVGFLLIGPYSYLAGAIALDFGGKRGSATASGLIDGVGYLGGVLAGESVARLAVMYGWRGAFTTLAGVAWFSCLAAMLYYLDQRRQPAFPS